jgi:hypothetical protein
MKKKFQNENKVFKKGKRKKENIFEIILIKFEKIFIEV